MARHIAGYEAAWHPDKHRGVIFLEFADGGKRGWMQRTLLSSPHYSTFFVMGLP